MQSFVLGFCFDGCGLYFIAVNNATSEKFITFDLGLSLIFVNYRKSVGNLIDRNHAYNWAKDTELYNLELVKGTLNRPKKTIANRFILGLT